MARSKWRPKHYTISSIRPVFSKDGDQRELMFEDVQHVRFLRVRRQRQIKDRLAGSVPSDQAGEKRQKVVHIRE